MLILFHIVIALLSLLFSGFVFFSPSQVRLKIAYGLVFATLASGTYLVVNTHANMLHACTMGLIYLAIVSFGIANAHHKLALEKS
jgi:hypothetical protein